MATEPHMAPNFARKRKGCGGDASWMGPILHIFVILFGKQLGSSYAPALQGWAEGTDAATWN